MCPYAYGDGQKFKHGLHGEHGFGFFTDFLVGKWLLDLFSYFRGFASAWALPFSEKHLITFYRIHHPIIHQEGSAPVLAILLNPN